MASKAPNKSPQKAPNQSKVLSFRELISDVQNYRAVDILRVPDEIDSILADISLTTGKKVPDSLAFAAEEIKGLFDVVNRVIEAEMEADPDADPNAITLARFHSGHKFIPTLNAAIDSFKTLAVNYLDSQKSSKAKVRGINKRFRALVGFVFGAPRKRFKIPFYMTLTAASVATVIGMIEEAGDDFPGSAPEYMDGLRDFTQDPGRSASDAWEFLLDYSSDPENVWIPRLSEITDDGSVLWQSLNGAADWHDGGIEVAISNYSSDHGNNRSDDGDEGSNLSDEEKEATPRVLTVSEQVAEQSYEDVRRGMVRFIQRPFNMSGEQLGEILGTSVPIKFHSMDQNGYIIFEVECDEDLSSHIDEHGVARCRNNGHFAAHTLRQSYANADISTIDGRTIRLGGRTLSSNNANPGTVFIGMYIEDLDIDSDRSIELSIGNQNLEVSMREIAAYMNGIVTYGGANIVPVRAGHSSSYNHSRDISRPGDPLMHRLVSQVVDESDSREQQIRDWVRFLGELDAGSNNTSPNSSRQYDYVDANLPEEESGMAVDVIFSGGGDCNILSTFLASGLEQLPDIGNADGDTSVVPYWLTYEPRHMGVMLGGDFGNSDSYYYDVNGQKATRIETTGGNFRLPHERSDRRVIHSLHQPYARSGIIFGTPDRWSEHH